MIFTNIIYTTNYQRNKELIATNDLIKLEQAIEVHGYRGASKKKHNGVVPIKDSDTGLLKKYYQCLNNYGDLLEVFKKGTPVKVVAHVPNGNRLIGCMVKVDGQLNLYVLDIANYSGKIDQN